MDSRKKIIRKLQSTLSPRRYQHTLGVEKTAISLAKHYKTCEEQASTAGLLHDCAKNIPYEVMREYCKSYKINLSEFKDFPQIVHSFLGAEIAEKEYNISDHNILNAIRYHTTGRSNMTLLEKIIFLSDYIEPGRKTFEGLQEVREMVYVDLDRAVYMTLNSTIKYLLKMDVPIHPLTIDSEKYYRQLN
ncbi:bis(5'-nucleosyl)-tetraphosphatase (symmetrical) YqeK [Vallitalea okinawensis]|uniref:bis(5'-nucleosyl)-tetraphosphatase (symmetrical) YqeK n=1 Tax=Vallitalea okinawensis TaxID=2078660 RepID=UPI000CFAF010|nr:bis(5'-nucleosyl)-tetraphosphatase (symmetrical) YqeK [Vallitalea okinawensis]